MRRDNRLEVACYKAWRGDRRPIPPNGSKRLARHQAIRIIDY